MIKRVSILVFAVMFMFFAFLAHAQVRNENVSLEINPNYPRANEEVKATISSYTTDLNKSKVSWKVNDVVSIEAVGKKDFYFKVGEAGSQTYLEVEIQAPDGSFINKKITITPADIDMLWEATDSYVPPFYRGKALLTSEGTIKVVALTSSRSGTGLSYNWKLDGNNKPDSSGYKKNYFIFKNSYIDEENSIEVTTSSFAGTEKGQGEIIIKPVNPKIVFYQKDPSLGVKYEKAMGDGFNTSPNGNIFVVEPYFFSPKDLGSEDLRVEWFIEDSKIETPIPKNELGIRPEPNQSGKSSLSISIENIKKMFLSASKKINVFF